MVKAARIVINILSTHKNTSVVCLGENKKLNNPKFCINFHQIVALKTQIENFFNEIIKLMLLVYIFKCRRTYNYFWHGEKMFNDQQE